MGDAATQSVEVQTGHVGLNVTDLKRSVRFYERRLRPPSVEGVGRGGAARLVEFRVEEVIETLRATALRWRPAGQRASIPAGPSCAA